MRRPSSNSLAALLANDFDDHDEDQEIATDVFSIDASGGITSFYPATGGGGDEPELDRALSRSLAKTKQLLRNVSHSMRRMAARQNDPAGTRLTSSSTADDGGPDGISSGCLRLYSRGTGCKVGACEEFEFLGSSSGGRKGRRNSYDECLPTNHQTPRPEAAATVLLHRMFRRRSFVKERTVCVPRTPPPTPPRLHHHQPLTTPAVQRRREASWAELPDDVVEMCLVRLPLSSLMTARLVCRRWRALSTTSHFMQMRAQGSYQTPWLFLLGVTNRYNGCGIEDQQRQPRIHALDVSMDRWHTIAAGCLHGRYMFSVAGIGTDLYVVGGRSSPHSRHHPPTIGRSSSHSSKAHKSVFVFSPLTNTWSKAASMKWSRSGAILGVLEILNPMNNYSTAFNCLQPSNRRSGVLRTSRTGRGVSDVYEDPHRCSLRRRQLRDAFSDSDDDEEEGRCSSQSRNTTPPPVKLEKKTHDDDKRRYAIIAVGGMGSSDEPLNTAEVYDPTTNRWMPIAPLPADFGVPCSGAACNGAFYVYSDADKLTGYSLESGTWTRIHFAAPPPPRLQEYLPNIMACDGKLFMISVSWCERNQRSNKAVRKVWELNSSSTPSSSPPSSPFSWTEVSRHPDAPMDFHAAFTGQGGSIYGVEMFKVFGQLLSFVTACDVSGPYKWTRVSRSRSALGANAASCKAKAVAVLHL